jgi:hypothetical protein
MIILVEIEIFYIEIYFTFLLLSERFANRFLISTIIIIFLDIELLERSMNLTLIWEWLIKYF